MKSLVAYVKNILEDSGMWCNVSTQRDFKTISQRVKDEGVSFLTITLPTFSQFLERSIENGRLVSSGCPGFRLDSRGFPLFLGGFLRLIFDSRTGTLLSSPSTDAIRSIRQVSNFAKKIELPCSPSRNRKAIEGYEQCDSEVKANSEALDTRFLSLFHDASICLFGSVIATLGRKIRKHEHVPKHGPGATAEKLSANGRYTLTEWNSRLEDHFPYDLFAIPNWGCSDVGGDLDLREPGIERPSRLCSVPKTLKTPRLIAIEPACMQYTQQSILELLVPLLEHPRFENALGFTDQSMSRDMARKASIDQQCSTIDLSEASDRVSNLLVRLMFASDIVVSDAIQACRSEKVDVFGKVLTLSKFASMGSALCFPIEAMVFLTILRIADCKRLGVPASSRKGLKAFLRSVRVYGDDIIIPTHMTSICIEHLELFGLKVNTNKSFWNSNFREACGGDYFNGVDVKPIYFRKIVSRTDRSTLVSLISTRNQFYKAGFWKTASHLDKVIRSYIPYPIVEESSPVQGRFSFLPYAAERICSRLHRPLVKGLVLKPRSPKDEIDGYGALLKFFLKRGDKPRDKDHLTHYGRSSTVYTKLTWATPY